jgi:hypothetical protein
VFLRKYRALRWAVSICWVTIFVLTLSGFLQAQKDPGTKGQGSVKIELTLINEPVSLKYGDMVLIQNGYQSWQGGYLDVCGSGCQGNYLCVSTSTNFNRANGSGTWQILSASGKAIGQPVMAFDNIHLLNQWSGNGGYLDVNGKDCNGGYLCVSTATTDNRANGSGTWKIVPETCVGGGGIQTSQVIRLLNAWNDYSGGFLDVNGAGCQSNLYCVSTTLGWNRTGNTTSWRFRKVTIN